MARPGMRWRHVIISTYCSWLPGDPRGFRSKEHKLHSSGYYKVPPPPGEHDGLHAYCKRISGPHVVIPQPQREMVSRAILAKLKKLGYACLTISVSGIHTHIQVELPDDLAKIRHVIGQCKTVSSHAIRAYLPGRVWARDGAYKPIDSVQHQRNVHQYILSQEGAWTWSYNGDSPSLGASAASPEGNEARVGTSS
jgi:hypothetical protein